MTILDILDHYPAILKNSRSFLRRLYGRMWNLDTIERRCLKEFDILSVVCPESKSYLMKKHNLKATYRGKFCVIYNVPLLKDIENLIHINRMPKDDSSKDILRMVYTGHIDKNIRDFDTVVEAFKLICKEIPLYLDCYCTGYSTGSKKYISNLVEEIKNHSLPIKVLPPIGYKSYFQMLKTYNLGIVPHNDNCLLYTSPSPRDS